MTTSTIHYQQELRTECTHIASTKTVITDAPVDNNGKGDAFSPTDLLATSLVSCMLTLMGIAAGKANLHFQDAHATMTKLMGTNPRRVVEIRVDITMPHHAYSPTEKALLEEAGLTCPVAKSLHPDLKQSIQFHYPKG